MKKILFIIILIFQFTSCQTNTTNSVLLTIDFNGFYKIESIISKQTIDLNNENTSSQNFYKEKATVIVRNTHTF